MKNNFKDLFNLKKYRIYIIGGCGLIGSQIVKALEEFGASITVFDLDIKKVKTQKLNMLNLIVLMKKV